MFGVGDGYASLVKLDSEFFVSGGEGALDAVPIQEYALHLADISGERFLWPVNRRAFVWPDAIGNPNGSVRG